MGRYIQVSEDEIEEPIELPLEDDCTLLFSTLTAQYPGACGLKFHGENKTYRGVKLADGKFHPPDNDWAPYVYYCVFLKENKRKSDDSTDNLVAKTKRMDISKCTDLIVLGLPWDLTEVRLKSYFEAFGELLMTLIKKDAKTGNSKGYGFIRFAKYESQVRVLATKHKIDQRTVTVKIPNSQEGSVPSSKIFVGRVTEEISVDDLTEHFSQYGEVLDVFIPKPFRAFAFVTFLNPLIAQSLLGEDHIIKGVSIHIGEATPKNPYNRAGSTDGHSDIYQPQQNKNIKEAWNKRVNENPNFKGPNLTSGLLSALGLNPALIAALNQASWDWMHQNNSGSPIPPGPHMPHMSHVTSVNGNYSNSPTSIPNPITPRPYPYNVPPYRENWWGGTSMPRQGNYPRNGGVGGNPGTQYNKKDRSGTVVQ